MSEFIFVIGSILIGLASFGIILEIRKKNTKEGTKEKHPEPQKVETYALPPEKKPQTKPDEPSNQEIHANKIRELLEEIKIIKQEVTEYNTSKKKSTKTRKKPTRKIMK